MIFNQFGLAAGLSYYLTVNILIALAVLFLLCVRLLNRGGSMRSLLKLHVLALVTIVALPLAMLSLPKQSFFQPAAKIWSATSIGEVAQSANATDSPDGYFLIPTESGFASVSSDGVATSTLLGLSLLTLAGISYLVRDLRRLIKLRKSSHLVRRISSVGILVSDEISVPFSYWLPGQTNVVIPLGLISKMSDYRIAVQHELQHHRQGDTKFVYLLWLLRLLCLANPFVHLWARELCEIQEFACDETLVDLKKVDSHAYARCLVEVVETANGLKRIPVCATGLAFQTRGTLLKRRINTMLFQKNRVQKKSFLAAGAIGLIAMMTAAAYASTGLVQDRRVTIEQAEKMLAKTKSVKHTASTTDDFAVTVNERVLRHLNRYIGTPEGREFMRSALTRLQAEAPAIEKAMKRYGVPRELLAMPIIESGYQNLPQSATSSMKAAGLWQFVPRTAQLFGLRVDGVTDERMNVALETDAAMRLLVSNKMRFQDWLLSVAAYNAGEYRVQEGIEKTGSRDAWTLVGRGFEGDHDYLAKLMAAILIMHNPESVQ